MLMISKKPHEAIVCPVYDKHSENKLLQSFNEFPLSESVGKVHLVPKHQHLRE